MADKKYYWLKLKDDFYDSKLVKKIRRLAGGDTYCIIYQRMILSSMKNNGKLIFDGLEDDLISEIALDLDETVENVRATVGILMSAGKIETLSENEFKMIDFEEMTGSETEFAKKKREYRAKINGEKKLIETKKDNVRQEIEKEKEKEIDIELDKEIEIDKNNPSSSFNEKELEKKKHNIEKFISKLEKQFNTTIERIASDNIKRLCVLNDVNPLEAYENSDYLKGLADKKPTLSMFFKEKTYQNMKMKIYENKYNQKELVTYTDEERRKKEKEQDEIDRILGL